MILPFAKSAPLVRMRRFVRTGLALACATGLGAGPALAQSFDVTCTSPDDVRQIIVVAPGQTGKACDVQYTKNRGRTVSTPYFANSDQGYCLEKAALIQSKLTASNYQCAGAGSDLRPTIVTASASQEPAPADKTINSAQLRDGAADRQLADGTPSSARDAFLKNLRDQTTSEPALEKSATVSQAVRDQALAQYRAQQASGAASAATGTATDAARGVRQAAVTIATDKTAQPSAPVAIDGLPNEASVASVPSVPSVPAVRDVTGVDPASASTIATQRGPGAGEKTEQLVALQTGIARSGPVTLTNPAPLAVTDPAGAPGTGARSAVSREERQKLVGATPVAVSPVAEIPVAQKAAQTTNTASSNQALSPAPIRAVNDSFRRVASALSPAVANRPRSRPEIIKATLMAQTAAWNEGDIEAFMEGYWRDKALTFVSGTTVTHGWAPTLRRYKDRYGNGAALGQLGFDIANVEMLANDIAIVVGRFTLNRNGMIDSGTFTLVMKQFEGAWRIVHDHTVADAPAAVATETTATAQ
ncbi:MAG: DUF4440 domain-containing protein [Pseudomonadota bacterium]